MISNMGCGPSAPATVTRNVPPTLVARDPLPTQYLATTQPLPVSDPFPDVPDNVAELNLDTIAGRRARTLAQATDLLLIWNDEQERRQFVVPMPGGSWCMVRNDCPIAAVISASRDLLGWNPTVHLTEGWLPVENTLINAIISFLAKHTGHEGTLTPLPTRNPIYSKKRIV